MPFEKYTPIPTQIPMNLNSYRGSVQDTGGFFPNGYSYRRKITINESSVSGSGNLSNYPVLIDGTYSYLKTVSNGGKIEHASGYDIRFESIDGVKLDHEIENWEASTGKVSIWVRLPTLYGSVNTEFYIYYGKKGLSSSEENISGVWNSSYKAVYHMDQVPSAAVIDSTTYSRNLTPSNMESGDSINGQIHKGLDFDKTNEYASVADSGAGDNLRLGSATNMTIQAWIKTDDNAQDEQYIAGKFKWSGPTGYAILARSSGRVGIKLNGSAHSYVSANNVIDTTNKFLLHGVFSGGNRLRMYVNGIQVINQIIGSTSVTAATDVPFTVGCAPDALGASFYAFDGLIDEVRVLDTNLSSDWIQTEYSNQSNAAGFYSIGDEIVNGEIVSKLRVISLTDTGSNIDTVSLRNTLSVSDTIASSESLQSLTTILLNDTTTSNQTINLLKAISINDNISASELIQILATISLNDASVASEVITTLSAIAINDSSLSTDAIQVLATIAVSESTASAEAIDVLIQLSLNDATVGVTVIQVITSMLLSDYSNSNEVFVILNQLSLADSSLATEFIEQIGYLLVSETALSNEYIDVVAEIALSDSSASVDALGLLVDIFETDSIASNDALSVLVDIFENDTAIATELLNILTALSISDSSNTVENVSVASSGDDKLITDSSSPNDIVDIFNILIQDDTALSSDLLSVLVTTAVSDTGNSEEYLSILTSLIQNDSVSVGDVVDVIVNAMVQENMNANDVVINLADLIVNDNSAAIDFASTAFQEILISDTALSLETIDVLAGMLISDTCVNSDMAYMFSTAKHIQESVNGQEIIKVAINKLYTSNGCLSSKRANLYNKLNECL